MRILVTGAGGFLGGAIARRLAARGDDHVIAAVRRPPGPPDGLVLDLAARETIADVLRAARPDIVVHAAGRGRAAAADLFADNARATADLAAAMARATPAAALLLMGSAAQYGEDEAESRLREDDPAIPLDLYGLSKLAAETCAFAEARRAGLRITSLRLFNVVQAAQHGEQVFAHFLRKACAAARAGAPPWRVTMAPLGAVRDFVALDDVLTAVERVIDYGVWGEAINVCTGVGRPARALTGAVAEALDGDLVVEEGLVDGEGGGVAWSVGDPARCEARLGFRPSADLSALIRAAATSIAGEAATHARSDA